MEGRLHRCPMRKLKETKVTIEYKTSRSNSFTEVTDGIGVESDRWTVIIRMNKTDRLCLLNIINKYFKWFTKTYKNKCK